MHWWKVTLDKGGAIVGDPEQVDERSKNGRLVCYVLALDKAGACSGAKRWYEHQLLLARRRHREQYWNKRESAKCTKCPAPARPGKTQCANCAAKAVANATRYKRPDYTPAQPRDVAAQASASLDRQREHGRVYAQKRCTMTWSSLIEKFDQLGPTAFRSWLSERERDAEVRVAASRKAA